MRSLDLKGRGASGRPEEGRNVPFFFRRFRRLLRRSCRHPVGAYWGRGSLRCSCGGAAPLASPKCKRAAPGSTFALLSSPTLPLTTASLPHLSALLFDFRARTAVTIANPPSPPVDVTAGPAMLPTFHVHDYLTHLRTPAPEVFYARDFAAPGPLEVSPLHSSITHRQHQSFLSATSRPTDGGTTAAGTDAGAPFSAAPAVPEPQLSASFETSAVATDNAHDELARSLIGDWAWGADPQDLGAGGASVPAPSTVGLPNYPVAGPILGGPSVFPADQAIRSAATVLPLRSSVLPGYIPRSYGEPYHTVGSGARGNTAVGIVNGAVPRPPSSPYYFETPLEVKVYLFVGVVTLAVVAFLSWMFAWRRANCCRNRYGAAFEQSVGQASAVRTIIDSYVPI